MFKLISILLQLFSAVFICMCILINRLKNVTPWGNIQGCYFCSGSPVTTRIFKKWGCLNQANFRVLDSFYFVDIFIYLFEIPIFIRFILFK